MSVSRTLIRLAWGGLLGILLLVMLTVAAAGYLTATPQGLQFLVSQAQRWLPGELRVARIEGSLWGDLSLREVEYRSVDGGVSLERFHLEWEPTALLQGTLHIRTLAVGPLVATLPAAEAAPAEEKRTEPLTLPDLRLPLQLQLDAVNVQSVSVKRLAPADAETDPIASEADRVFDQLRLRAHSEGALLVLEQFVLEAPQGSLSLEGELTPQGDFPLHLTSDWRFHVPEQASLSGRGLLQGSLARLELSQQLTGLLKAQVSARLKLLQAEPEGTVAIEGLEVDLGLASPALQDRTLTGRLDVSAAGETVRVGGQLRAPLPELGASLLDLQLQLSPQRLQIERLRLQPAAEGAQVALQGDVDNWLEQPQLALQGQWQQLSYPLEGPARFSSGEGHFTLDGDLERYHLALEGAVAGTELPTGRWQLEARGSQTGLEPLHLQGTTLDGSLSVRGRVQWRPTLNWELALEGQELNPGAHWAQWPGSLSFQGETRGSLSDSAPIDVALTLEQLSGTLRGDPVAGQAQLDLNGETLTLQELQLSLAGAQLSARGELGEILDLDWSLAAPRLDKLLAGAEGALSARGALEGSLEQLQLDATLEGSDLKWQTQSIASLSGALQLDLGGSRSSKLRLDAEGLRLNDQRWQRLTLSGSGTPEQHRLDAALEEGPLALELALAGTWQEPRWQGTLERLILDSEQLGRWQSQAPVALAASGTEVDLARLCLEPEPKAEAVICAQGRWSADAGASGDAEVRGLGLQRLDPWLPPGTQTEGALWARATFVQPGGGRPELQLNAGIEDARLWLPDEDLNLVGETVSLTVNAEDERLNAEFILALQNPPGELQARVAVEDLYGQGALEGELEAQLSDLTFVSLLVPQVQVISGALDASLTLAGDYQAPVWRGQVQLDEARAEIPALGTRLEEITLVVRDRGEAPGLSIDGGVRSGEGRLTLTGQFDPLAGSGQASLTGERFQAVATKEVQAWISPAIEVRIEPELIQLRGELTVPEASITPPKVTTRTTASADVVVVDGMEQEAEGLERVLDARLRLTLGDQVEVDALGFTGRLQGSVVVVDDAQRATRATGTLEVAAGEYRLYGQDLNISRGSLVFSGGPVDNPGLDLRVSRQVEEVTVGARVGGTLREPRLSLFSDPAMPESNILSYLLLGRPPGAGSSQSEQEMLRNAAMALAIFGGNTLAENIQERLAVDELGLESGDGAESTSLYIGKYLSPRLYVKYGAGLLAPTNTFFIRYRLGKGWSLESQAGTESSGGDLVYILER